MLTGSLGCSRECVHAFGVARRQTNHGPLAARIPQYIQIAKARGYETLLLPLTTTWDLDSGSLKDAAERHNFLEFTVLQGYENGTGECRPLIMGIDASIWMYQVAEALNYGNTRAGPNPHLRVLYYRLVTLLQLPLRIVFVFDGPARPEFKRGTRVLTHGHWLTPQFRELIHHFGYHCHTAPAEAEAELGRLASEGWIDIVQTTDCDIFLFGAPRVIYVPNKKTDGENITLYSLENIFITPSVSLTRGGLLLVALLSGGDYDEGVPGCGIAIAHAVARGNLGDTLLQRALESSTPTAEFLEFLISWEQALSIEFSTDPHGHLGHKYKSVATTIVAGSNGRGAETIHTSS
ncbi:PIN domain-like protein [Mycena olivaceomarginata]|nr:PIN domain-like protein [Mycena olivaceomarginata]